MTYSSSAGLELPSEFDVTKYDSVNERAAKIANPNIPSEPTKKNAWHAYASAWNGVAFRLRATVDYHEEFTRSIVKTTSPGGDERYIQERALFGCVVSALSSIECFFMAAFGLGAALAPFSFLLYKPEHLVKYPRGVASCFLAGFPTAPFSEQLVGIANSSQLQALDDLRNSLAHRGVLPRRHYLSTNRDTPSSIPVNPKALAEDFSYTAHLSDQTTSTHSRWLLETLNSLVRGLDDFLATTAKQA